MTREQINVKLTIWGANRGSQIFCSDASPEEQNTQAFKDTLQEFSSVFSSAGLPFYGVEFTAEYKVYTTYYSALETGGARSGIFLAATIFVPHRYRLLDPLGYLQSMGQKVKGAFLDLNGRYKGGLPPSIEKDFSEYREVKVEFEQIERRDFSSNTRGNLAYIICPDDTSISAILREPYRREFKTLQEILLIPQSQIERGYFNTKVGQPLELNSLSRQHNGYRLLRNELITGLNIGGKDCTQNYDTQYLGLGTLLEMRLVRKGYEPITYPYRPLEDYLRSGLVRLSGEEVHIEEGKLVWRKPKKTVCISLRPEVFRQTVRVELQIGGISSLPMTKSRYDGNFSIDLEVDLLQKDATLYLYKEGENKPYSHSIGALEDANLVAEKCLTFIYPTPVEPKAVSRAGSSANFIANNSKPEVNHKDFHKGHEPKDGFRPRGHEGTNKAYDNTVKESPRASFVTWLRYWRGLLIALFIILLIGYILGIFLPLPISVQRQSEGGRDVQRTDTVMVRRNTYDGLSKFTSDEANSWLQDEKNIENGKLQKEGFWEHHKDGLQFLRETIKNLEKQLPNQTIDKENQSNIVTTEIINPPKTNDEIRYLKLKIEGTSKSKSRKRALDGLTSNILKSRREELIRHKDKPEYKAVLDKWELTLDGSKILQRK